MIASVVEALDLCIFNTGDHTHHHIQTDTTSIYRCVVLTPYSTSHGASPEIFVEVTTTLYSCLLPMSSPYPVFPAGSWTTLTGDFLNTLP